MDRQKSPLRPSSGIPRLTSRIPLPTSAAMRSIKPSPSRERLQADPGVDIARLRRPSQETLSRKPSTQFSSSSQFVRRRESSQTLHSRIKSPEFPEDTGTEAWELSDHNGYQTPAPSTDSRPSLSDRTVETLARIPPSPPPRGRKSLFSPSDSMGPPLRLASAFNNYSRSPSRSSYYQNSIDEEEAPSSTAKRIPARVSISLPSSRNSISQRTLSQTTDILTRSIKSSRQSLGPEKPHSIIGATLPKRSETLLMRPGSFSENKSLSTRSSKSRPSLTGAFAKPSPDEANQSLQSLSISKTRKPSSNFSSNLTSPSSTISKTSSVLSTGSEAQNQEHTVGKPDVRKVSKSSNALRESIAKAKAAKKAARQSNTGVGKLDPWDTVDSKDPFNQLPEDSNHGLLRKRIETARTSGSLNIAAMELKDLPNEVMTMYDFDPDGDSEWYENVDLVKFIAADNELEALPDAAFPDTDPEDFNLDGDSKGNQFGGLEVLDLHGNVLRSLPMGLRKLQRLSTLNLSNNNLGMKGIEVVTDIQSLSDLKLANNNLEGELLSAMGRLHHLEVLDLRGNQLSSLPDSFSELCSLKVLILSDNQLKSLPFEALSKLPLVEVNAAGNKLQASLISSTVYRFETLQTLDVAHNALERLSDNDSFDFPSLKTLAVDANRLRFLPCVSTWRSLLRLSAENNNISALPDGLLDLENLRHVNLTANDLSKLDERIGLMENLTTFRIANNPLRERKFLSMDTEDLKRDLRNRCALSSKVSKTTYSESHAVDENEANGEEEEEGSVETEFTLAPESPTHLNRWKVKSGGVLDRSSTKMADMDVDELKPLISTHDIKFLYIQRNKLQNFPTPALNLIAATLTDLDLSHNPLNSSTLLSSLLTLPNLQNLNLSATGLTSLDSLLTDCSAPSLKFLDISNNRLTGLLPAVRQTFPNLSTFLAADNQFSSLTFEGVQGLQVLDVSNNNIDFLPPRLGLLATEGSGPGLRRFEVAGNSFRVPRWQVVAKGTEAILEWLKGRIPAEELNN